MVTQRNHWNGSSREENKESPATQILLDSFLPPSVVPCAVLLLETPSGASYRKCLPKIHFKFSFEVPCSDLSKGSFPDLHLRFVFQIDIARHRDLAKGSFPDSSPSKKKTQKSKHLQTVIPNVLQELATDTELSKTSAGAGNASTEDDIEYNGVQWLWTVL